VVSPAAPGFTGGSGSPLMEVSHENERAMGILGIGGLFRGALFASGPGSNEHGHGRASAELDYDRLTQYSDRLSGALFEHDGQQQ
jgi:hypothetical protein